MFIWTSQTLREVHHLREFLVTPFAHMCCANCLEWLQVLLGCLWVPPGAFQVPPSLLCARLRRVVPGLGATGGAVWGGAGSGLGGPVRDSLAGQARQANTRDAAYPHVPAKLTRGMLLSRFSF